VSSFLILAGVLLPLRAISYVLMRARPFIERVLILGSSELARKLNAEIEGQAHCGYRVAGVGADDAGALGPDAHLLGPVSALQKIVEDQRPDRIVVAMAERRGRMPVDQLLAVRVSGVSVDDSVEVYEHLTGKLAVEAMTPSYLIFSKDFRKS